MTITMTRAPTMTEAEARARRHQVYVLLRQIGLQARQERLEAQRANSGENLGGDAPLLAQSDAQSDALDAQRG